MFKLPSSVFVKSTSKNVSLLSCSSSFVNVMFFVVLLIVCKMLSTLSYLTVASTSSTYLSHVLMSLLLVTALHSKSCITVSARKLESGDPIGVPEICLQYLLSKQNSVERHRSSKSRISWMSRSVLLCHRQCPFNPFVRKLLNFEAF